MKYKHLYRKCKPEEMTQDILMDALEYNQDTGDFFWRVCPSRKIRVGQKAGCFDTKGYWLIGLHGEHYFAHRLAWLYVHGCWPSNKIDHMDGNGLNNAISNLRDVTDAVNSQNQRRPRRGGSSGLLGVSWATEKRKWCAHIQAGGKQKNLGYYSDKYEAYRAYVEAKREMHEGCTL